MEPASKIQTPSSLAKLDSKLLKTRKDVKIPSKSGGPSPKSKVSKPTTVSRVRKTKASSLEESKDVPVCSSQKMIKISWFFCNPEDEIMAPSALPKGKFGLCYCPGKKIKMGRDGRVHDRDLVKDLTMFRQLESNPVTMIVCLLSDYELKSIGVQVKGMCFPKIRIQPILCRLRHKVHSIPYYRDACTRRNCVDAGSHKSPRCRKNLLIHCRGGNGRAGTVAGCLLAHYYFCQTGLDPSSFTQKFLARLGRNVIAHVRKIRGSRAIECSRQEDFVKKSVVNEANEYKH
ncbi:unnamed protein product [Moneuplotes crassus]|uniref:Swiss Army Knife protein DSP-PTPase phosphatase domain-containing protein n=1 Tax=Euplotes crassus TaxID=5936 RepID=A0AAD1UQM0_EUPCR|nr:unnamed protein product [Moneuplotes crassus]